MNNDYENSVEYKSLLEIVKMQEQLQKKIGRIYSNIPQETISKINEISEKLNSWKNSISNFPGLQVMAEALKNYEKEIREDENLSETEFEEKYKRQIVLSEKLGRNGWVISQHSNLASSEQWNELLEDGEAELQAFFDGDECPILDIIEAELRKKYITGTAENYYTRGIKAFENNDYMTAAMYFLGLLDYRIGQLVVFPGKPLRNKERYSNVGFADQKTGDFHELTQGKRYITKKILFLETYPSLIEYLNRVFYDGTYPFQNGIEPPYLNRNWLMHGRMSREVERYECIQVLNAISVVEFMFGKDEIDEKYVV